MQLPLKKKKKKKKQNKNMKPNFTERATLNLSSQIPFPFSDFSPMEMTVLR